MVFVALDFESVAHSQKPTAVTEGGAAFLDSREIAKLKLNNSPDEDVMKAIRSSHMRVFKRGKSVNRRWAISCGHAFDYGKSQWIMIEDMIGNSGVLANIVCIPNGEGQVKACSIGKKRRQSSSGLEDHSNKRFRSVVLVGHDFKNDSRVMEGELEFNVNCGQNIVAALDTQSLFSRAGTNCKDERRHRKPGLSWLLEHMYGYQPENPHNAGNDAVYTLLALVNITIEEAHKRGHLHSAFSTGIVQHDCKADGNRNKARVDELKMLAKADPIRCDVNKFISGHRLCDNCGGNNHRTEDCTIWSTCELCGAKGHSREQCRPEWRSSQDHRNGNHERYVAIVTSSFCHCLPLFPDVAGQASRTLVNASIRDPNNNQSPSSSGGTATDLTEFDLLALRLNWPETLKDRLQRWNELRNNTRSAPRCDSVQSSEPKSPFRLRATATSFVPGVKTSTQTV